MRLKTYDTPLEKICWTYVDREGENVLSSHKFLEVDRTLLERIIERDSLRVYDEGLVYRAAVSWAKASLKRKSKQCNDAAIRKELGAALFKIRFAQMKPVSFASGPGRSKVLTDKEKSDIYQYRFDDSFKLRGFVLVKRDCVGARDDEIIESCDPCGNADDAFVECCDDVYLRVKQKKWSTARCPKEGCNRFAYRCRCGELCIDQADGYNSTCFGCRLTVHLCGKGVSQLRNFEKGEDCDHCKRVPVTEDDSSANSSSDSSDSEEADDSSDD